MALSITAAVHNKTLIGAIKSATIEMIHSAIPSRIKGLNLRIPTETKASTYPLIISLYGMGIPIDQVFRSTK